MLIKNLFNLSTHYLKWINKQPEKPIQNEFEMRKTHKIKNYPRKYSCKAEFEMLICIILIELTEKGTLR